MFACIGRILEMSDTFVQSTKIENARKPEQHNLQSDDRRFAKKYHPMRSESSCCVDIT
jgi:hypothetical protein